MQLNPRAQGAVAGHRTRGLLVWSIATLVAALALALAMVVASLALEPRSQPAPPPTPPIEFGPPAGHATAQ